MPWGGAAAENRQSSQSLEPSPPGTEPGDAQDLGQSPGEEQDLPGFASALSFEQNSGQWSVWHKSQKTRLGSGTACSSGQRAGTVPTRQEPQVEGSSPKPAGPGKMLSAALGLRAKCLPPRERGRAV